MNIKKLNKKNMLLVLVIVIIVIAIAQTNIFDHNPNEINWEDPVNSNLSIKGDVEVNSLTVNNQVPFSKCSIESDTFTDTTSSIECLEGTKVISGGCDCNGSAIIETSPSGQGWFCECESTGSFTIYARCCS